MVWNVEPLDAVLSIFPFRYSFGHRNDTLFQRISDIVRSASNLSLIKIRNTEEMGSQCALYNFHL